jgi:aspartyl-tRNA(Asn)/glutamyl-tRNA(Gln) amidotransferase subunit C
MPLTLQEVEHIAHLARLELTEEEKVRYREQLSAILDHVAQLQKLDTASIPPTAGMFQAASPLRPDLPRPSLPREVLLQNAPGQQDGQFKIPPVFE